MNSEFSVEHYRWIKRRHYGMRKGKKNYKSDYKLLKNKIGCLLPSDPRQKKMTTWLTRCPISNTLDN